MSYLNEGAEMGDLARLVEPKLTIDEYRSKMGDDKDIVVLGMTVFSKEPGNDLVNFIEKSYDWVLDADLSSGETSDGNYMVFVEMQRGNKSADQVWAMLNDIINLTDQKIEDWRFTYLKDSNPQEATLENLKASIISSPIEYATKTDDSLGESRMFNSLRALAGVYVNPSKVTDMQILSIQRAAGIK